MPATVQTLTAPGTRHNSTERANRLQVKASSGTLLSLIGTNFGPSQYIQLHQGQASPANGAVPLFTFPVPPVGIFSLDIPIAFAGGIWVCNSTESDTLEAGDEDCWFLAHEI